MSPVLARSGGLGNVRFAPLVGAKRTSISVVGRSRHWIKSKNPAAPAVKREAEEDWGNQSWR
jgi:hypothetical protein